MALSVDDNYFAHNKVFYSRCDVVRVASIIARDARTHKKLLTAQKNDMHTAVIMLTTHLIAIEFAQCAHQ